MSVPLPAPLWRRLIAALYDGLLLIALWMVAALVDTLIGQQLLGLPRSRPLQMAYFFLVGLGFFGWFWTHGGQTLGMRAWRLRARRSDGQPMRWLSAATRYAGMLLLWLGLPIAITLLASPRIAATHPQAPLISGGLLAFAACALLFAMLDPRRRTPHDWISGTEVIVEPKAG